MDPPTLLVRHEMGIQLTAHLRCDFLDHLPGSGDGAAVFAASRDTGFDDLTVELLGGKRQRRALYARIDPLRGPGDVVRNDTQGFGIVRRVGQLGAHCRQMPASAVVDRFVAVGRVVRAGRQQVFTTAKLFGAKAPEKDADNADVETSWQ